MFLLFQCLEKLLFGLGIKEVGSKMAKQLAKMFLDIDTIMSKSVEELKAINDVGAHKNHSFLVKRLSASRKTEQHQK